MRIILLLIFFLSVETLFSQNSYLGESNVWNKKTINDELSFWKFFSKGKIQGQVRNYTSITLNQGELNDYYANALGLAMRYQTERFHGFQLTVGGSIEKNLFSSDLTAKDPLSNSSSRYEMGLYDLQNNDYKSFLYRLEEANLSFEKGKFKTVIGNQYLQTPLLNIQDGRMRPTMFSGIWTHFKLKKNLGLAGGWLPFTSPRSSFSWMNISSAIGINSQGVNAVGQANSYKNNLSSVGIFVLGAKYDINERIQVQIWDFLLENISNTIYAESKYRLSKSNENPLHISGQFITQQRTTTRNSNTYLPTHYYSISWGLQLVKSMKHWEHIVAFNRIENAGEFLSPREFGRDPFFTFMNRERLEGISNSMAFVAGTKYTLKAFACEIKSGYFHLPAYNDFAHNKYGLPSYWHTNLSLSYTLPGKWNGLKISTLTSYKKQIPTENIPWKYIANKVNMWHFDIVLNYNF